MESIHKLRKRGTLEMFSVIKKIDDSSKTRELKASLKHLCDLVLMNKEVEDELGELGYPLCLYERERSPDYDNVMGQVTAYETLRISVQDKIEKHEVLFLNLLGLSKAVLEYVYTFRDLYTKYALREISFSELIEEFKVIVWIEYKRYVLRCPEVVEDNIIYIGLLPKRALKELKSELFKQRKEDATERPKLIVEKSIKIELSAKTI
ncbi:hypothetical protein ABEW33_27300 [Priestia megaterium]|uniref:hypothetical protein n=1 Tax=Priestia megaterium TaxID=1404 RepID=UPI0030C9C745